jgi:hypothetical protein
MRKIPHRNRARSRPRARARDVRLAAQGEFKILPRAWPSIRSQDRLLDQQALIIQDLLLR